MNISDFKTKFPAYKDVNDNVLADAIHKKYYTDAMSLSDFRGRVGLSQEVISAPPEPTLMEEARNFFRRPLTSEDRAEATVDMMGGKQERVPVEGEMGMVDTLASEYVAVGEAGAEIGSNLLKASAVGLAGAIAGLKHPSVKVGGESFSREEAMTTAMDWATEVIPTIEAKTTGGKQLVKAANYPFEKLHEVSQVAGNEVLERTGNANLAAMVATAIEASPLALGLGKSGAVKVWGKVKKSNAYRMATVKERGLVVQSLEETIARNPKVSEAELIRKSDQYFKEAKESRAKTEGAVEEVIQKETPPVEPVTEPPMVKPTPTPKEVIKPPIAEAKPVKPVVQKPVEPPPVIKEKPPVVEEIPTEVTSLEKYSVYKLTLSSGEKRFGVRVNMDGAYGNPIFDTIEEARKEAKIKEKRDIANEKTRIEDKKRQAEKDKIEAVKQREYEEIDGFASDKTPMQRGKILKTLNKKMTLNKGELKTLKQHVRDLVDKGEPTSAYEVDKIKPMTRRQSNRATQREQDAHDARIIEAGKKKEYYIGGFSLGKTAYDYANHISTKPLPKKKPIVQKSISEAPSTPTKKPQRPILTEKQKQKSAKKKAVYEQQLKMEDAKLEQEGVAEQIREKRYALNLAAYETNLFVNDINKVTTSAQREIIPFIIEKTGVPKKLNRPDLEAEYIKSRDALAPIVEQIRVHFKKSWEEMKKHIKDMTAQELENYVTHIWDIARSKKQEVTNWFTTQDRFTKKRFVETLQMGIDEFGLKPKTLDIGEIIKIHDAVRNRAIQNSKIVDYLSKLKRDGVPLMERSDLAPTDWVPFDHPALRKNLVIPGELKRGEKISPELQDLLGEMGVAIGRRISPTVFGKPNTTLGTYKHGEPPEISFQRFMSNKTISHEIGHHLDKVLNLGDKFLERHKTELYALNKERIGKLEKAGKGEYATQTDEQIAEAFAHMFSDPKKMQELAPNAMADILNRLKEDKVLSKLIDFDFEHGAKNIIEEQMNTLMKVGVSVHPDLAKPMRVLFESIDPSPPMRAYDSIAGVLKKTNLSLSLFHHGALGETGVAIMGLWKTLGIYNPVKLFNALQKGDYAAYNNVPIARDGIGHGVQMGVSADIPAQKIQKQLNDIAFKMKDVPLANKITEFMSTFNEKWDKALWDYLHDTLKLYAYESLVSKHIDPKFSPKKIKERKEEIAQQVNDTFGGQNWDVLMVSPRTVQLLTRTLLSADWTVSTMRQAASPFGLGAIHKSQSKFKGKMGRMFWLKAFVYFGIGIPMLNAVFRQFDKKENPEYYKHKEDGFIWDTIYGNVMGHKTHLFVGRYEDGSERYVRWGKQFREMPEMIYDDVGFSPVSASVKKILGKANPNIHLISKIATGHSASGFKDDDIYGKRGWDWTWGAAKAILKSPLPFSTRTLLDKDKETYLTDIAMPSSKGMSRWKASDLFKTAIRNQDERLLKEIYQDALENGLPAYTLFNSAIVQLNAEESRAYSKSVKNIEDVKDSLKDIKNPKEAIRVRRKLKRLMKESADIKSGLALLGVAKAKSRMYAIDKD